MSYRNNATGSPSKTSKQSQLVQKVELGEERDMSSQWGEGSVLYDVYDESGATISIKIPNKYVDLAGIDRVFDKMVINIRSKLFVSLIDQQIDAIKQAAIKVDPKLGGNNVTWSSITSESGTRVALTKQTKIKQIGSSQTIDDASALEGIPFSAYVVLVTPFVYFNAKSMRASVPVHVRSIGIVRIHDDLEGIDIKNLALAD